MSSGCSLYKNYDPTKYHVHAWDIVHDWLISCFLSLFIINCFPTGSIICIWFNALKPDAIIKTLCLVKGRWTVAMEALKISWRFRCIQFQYKKIQWCQNFCCIRILMIRTFFSFFFFLLLKRLMKFRLIHDVEKHFGNTDVKTTS